MKIENDFIITVNNKILREQNVEDLSLILNNPVVELLEAEDFIIGKPQSCGQELNHTPAE